MIADTRKDIVVADTNWKEYWAERYGKIDYDLESFKITDDYISDIGNSEININNKQYLLKKGQESNDLKVLSGNSKSIQVLYKNKRITLLKK